MNERLEKENLKTLLLKLAAPCILAQMVSLLYSLVDRIYIGSMRDGVAAMAAVGLCVPLVNVITALSSLFGRGGAPLAAIAMGEGKPDEAQNIFHTSVTWLFLVSLGGMILIYLFQNPLLVLLGATEATLELTRTYLLIYTAGTIFSVMGVGLNYYINTQGYTGYGMFSQVSGALLNLLLDPLFIFVWNMGIAGAALATVLSQFFSFLVTFLFFFGKKSGLRLRPGACGLHPRETKKICALGASPCFMSASEGLLTLCFNQQLLTYGGTEALSSMTILSSMFQLLLHPMEGVAQGSQPILSYNYGAGNMERVRQTIRTAVTVNLIVSLCGTLAMELFPDFFVSWFYHDSELIAFARPMLRIYIFGCCIMGANSTFQQTYISLGSGGHSFFFAFLRKIILLIPLLYLLPALNLFPSAPWLGVVLAEPVSDLITTLSNCFVFRRFLKKKTGGESQADCTYAPDVQTA